MNIRTILACTLVLTFSTPLFAETLTPEKSVSNATKKKLPPDLHGRMLPDTFFSSDNPDSEDMRFWRSTVLNPQHILDTIMSLSGVSYAYFHLSPLPDEHTKDKKLRLTREYLVRIQGDERVMSISREVIKTVQEILKIQPKFYQTYLDLLNDGYLSTLSSSVKNAPNEIFTMLKKCQSIPVDEVYDNISQTDSALKQILEMYRTFTPFYEKELRSFIENDDRKYQNEKTF